MTRSLYQQIEKRQQEDSQSGQPWVIAVPAIVAVNEDPEHQHRVKAVIPLLDETAIHDEWIKQLGGFAGSSGYGNFDVPTIGSEIVLFGFLGQSDQLYYLCVYNENNLVPGDFDDETARGTRSDGDYKIISRGDLILEGGRVLIKSAFGTIQISAAAGLIIDPADEGGGGAG